MSRCATFTARTPVGPRTFAALALVLFALASALGACAPPPGFGNDAATDATNDLVDVGFGGFEAAVDARLPGRVCTRNAQCDDGIECTDDLCLEGRCVSTPNSGRCDNGRFCDGAELCDTRRGCVRGDPMSCDDSDVCTADRCDEESRTCMHRPLDRDGDGDPDYHCTARPCGDAGVAEPDTGVMTTCWRGRDCDDRDPRVNSTSREICGDMVDNNCNGFIDDAEPGGCARAPHDQCNDPLDISAGGVFSLDLSAARQDYALGCLGGATHDVVTRFRLTEPRDVAIDGSTRNASVGLALQRVDQCGMVMGDPGIDCDNAYQARLRVHSLPAGEYVVVVATTSNEPVQLTAQFLPATPTPSNDTCETATVIPPEGGTFRSDLIGLTNDVSTRCGGAARDALYTFTLDGPRNVVLQLSAGRNNYAQLSLLRECNRTTMLPTLKCDAGATVLFTAYSLPAGRYYVAVESYAAIEYTLQVRIAAPTAPPLGDVCSAPVPLVAGTPRAVSGAAFENDYALSCYSSGGDGVFQFDLTERRDVMLDVRGGVGEYFGVAVASTCGEMMSERACIAASNPRAFALSLDPGRYYALVKNGRGADYSVTLQTYPPVATTMVSGNDTCASAYLIPPGRAYLRGTTTALTNDYRSACVASAGNDAVYRLTLAVRSRVTMVLESAFFAVLSITSRAGGACPGTAPMVSGSTCVSGTRSTLDLVLDPGDYNVFVDGYTSTANGTYSLLVQSDPM